MNKPDGIGKKVLVVILFIVGTLFLSVGIALLLNQPAAGIFSIVIGAAALIIPVKSLKDYIINKKSEGKNWIALPSIAAAILVLFTVAAIAGQKDKKTEDNKLDNTPAEESVEQTTEETAEETTESETTCNHSWKDADCTTPKACTLCGVTEGTAKGHTWNEATCTEPKKCSVCGATEGESLGHDAPKLSCTEGDTCTRCGEKVEALGHDWKDATCTEPKTCARCGKTEGKANGHSPAESVKENETAASCTEDGKYDEVVYCAVCHEELSRKTETEKALGHTTTNGVCSRCGNEVYETVNGSGDDVITDVSVGKGLYKVHFTNSGSRNFIVWVHDSSGDKDLAVNTIGKYDGYYFLLGESPFTFEIKSNGKWTYTIEPIGTTSEKSFSGKGNAVTGMFTAPSGKYHLSHDGERNFIVWLYTTSGRDLVVNDIGKYDGNCLLTIPSDSFAILVIQADGNWVIEPG